ncbi:hypothetical protein [Ammoniphilus oxalaticus]|uniref:hypothetical protein n=1 Tax=Ammoniphilus oxalaticus TaxID=66863 RepID=UPI0011C47E96|nr:hypothetical protein [Ammoniphilus oxalaticus]
MNPYLSKQPTYGDKRCPACGLTVALFLNGDLVPCPYGPPAFYHFGCRHPPTEARQPTDRSR